MALAGLLALAACEPQEDTAAPVIDYVRFTRLDSATNEAGRAATVAIIGKHLASTQKVFFNDAEAFVNATYVTETAVIVRIPENAPYKNASNQVKLVTRFGETSKDFSIRQPLPLFTKFEPSEAAVGDTVTITGDYFDNLVEVNFGTVKAQVVSSTPTAIKVKVPEGVEKSLIRVVTPAGFSQSRTEFAPKGRGYFLYQDGLENGFQSWSWAKVTLDDATRVKSGSKSCKVVFGGYSALWFNAGDKPLDLTGFTQVKFWVYGGEDNDKKVQVFYRDTNEAAPESGKGVTVTLKAKQWAEVTLKLSDLGTAKKLQSLVFQEFGGTGDQADPVYFDDVRLQ